MLDPKLSSSTNHLFDVLDDNAKNEVRSIYYSKAKKMSTAYLFLLLSVFLFAGSIPVHCFYLERKIQALVRTIVPFVLAVVAFSLIILFLMVFKDKGVMDIVDHGFAYFVWMAVLMGAITPFALWTIVDFFLVPSYVASANAKTADMLLRLKGRTASPEQAQGNDA